MSRFLSKISVVAMLVSVLSACSMIGFQDEPQKPAIPTLAELQPAVITDFRSEPITVSVDQVIDNYNSLLLISKDPELNTKVLHRLADLKLTRGEDIMADQAIDELGIAVDAYKGLLAKFPDRAENDQVYYQLAKTYDLQAKTPEYLAAMTNLVERHPGSPYFVETQFRRGEVLFTDNRYQEAEMAFKAVIDAGETQFLINAQYMLGWSLFKQSRYEAALINYTKALDLTVSDKVSIEGVDNQYRSMVNDMLRVMGIAFSYLDKADSLAALFQRVGPRPYEIIIYNRYSEQLLEQEQYTDALAVYRKFIEIHPLNAWAAEYQINVINTLRTAGFKSEIFDEKTRFVDVYRKGTDFWNAQEEADLAFTKEQLERLLPELASFHYYQGQKSAKEKAKASKGKQSERHIVAEHATKMSASFQQATIYFAAFADTFPEHERTPEMLFLLGESYHQLEQYEYAIEAYERAGYNYQGYEKASESAYAAIVSYGEIIDGIDSKLIEEREAWMAKRMDSQIRFFTEHPQDERASNVLYIVTTRLFSTKVYDQAIFRADQLLDWQPRLSAETRLEAQVIKAHSQYALLDFVASETAYKQVLVMMPKKDDRRDAIIENLAASVYKQAEAFLAKDEKENAIAEFLRVAAVAPTSKLRPNAEYDAATYLIELKKWNEAIGVLVDFRDRYPKHALLPTIPPKLALAYRESEQWVLAAIETKKLSEAATDLKEKKEYLFVTAELYDKGQDLDSAIKTYRSYANTYASPADVYMEAANRLAELYEETDKPLKRRFWLAKQMKTVDTTSEEVTDRMTYLAAAASSVLSNDAYVQYKRVKLTLPLNKAMAEKTKTMKAAITAYQKTSSYGISEFSTLAGYRIGEIYAQLSKDLMESDRPGNLNELELEQYEILLEEQAYPFEENAIDIHEQNAQRSWTGIYDDWVKASFESLKSLLPGRYNKKEKGLEAVNAIF